ncbi:unnamed protein product [Urochloa decumbens]|uniref:DUF1618 domain-containing protein n=1 Tax=Urochloa decumbens TaxID=240449 RepID=A0ABC8XQF9_9POAL
MWSARRAVSSSSALASTPATTAKTNTSCTRSVTSNQAESASLHPVPLPDYRLPRLDEFGIVPCGHEGHYLLAALALGSSSFHYQLHIYSSEDERWTDIKLRNPCPEVSKVITSKVITLGEGVIGWVDFQHGMLVCDLKKGRPSPRYIPLPEPLPENRDRLEALLPGPSTRRFRDLTCINGVIKFIEMEHQATEKPSDPSDKDLLFNSDCILSRRFKDVDKKPKQARSWNGWRVVTWSRTVSCSSWHKGSVIGVADISVDKSGSRCETVVEKILHSGFPILSPDADDILYLKSVGKFNDPNGWMIAVDLRRKRVEALGAYSSVVHNPLVKAYCSFTLSTHVNMDPGIKVSACCKITDVGSCADDPYNTPAD